MFRLVTLFTPDYRPATFCVPSIQEYAAKHGYAFTEHTRLLKHDWVPAWNKVLAIDAELNKAGHDDWVIWIDADIMIRNLKVRLEDVVSKDPSVAMMFSQDCKGICSGWWAVRRRPDVREFLVRLTERYTPAWPWEQASIKDLVETSSAVPKFELFPESVVSNPLTDPEEIIGSLAFHIWGNAS